jgi:hypothetical protein
MTGVIFGVLFILGGIAWALLVLGACSMASRPVANSEGAPALLGVAAIILGIVLIIWG